MSNITLTGKIIVIEPTQSRTSAQGKTFSTREFVIEFRDVINGVESQYPNFAKFQLVQDKTALLDSMQLGQQVTVHANVRGSKYTNKEGKEAYISNLNAWKIDAGQVAATQQIPTYPTQSTPSFPPPAQPQYRQAPPPSNQQIDDLPF